MAIEFLYTGAMARYLSSAFKHVSKRMKQSDIGRAGLAVYQ